MAWCQITWPAGTVVPKACRPGQLVVVWSLTSSHRLCNCRGWETMSADVNLDAVGSCILFYCCDGLLVIYVLITVSGLYMNSTSRPTSCLVDGVKIHAHGDLTGDYRLRNDLYCVGWGVKLYSIQSYGGSPRRNSKGPEPRGSHEFTTLGNSGLLYY